MRKLIFLTEIWSLLLLARPTAAQDSWNQIPLTGSNAKIISLKTSPRFSIRFTMVFPLGNINPQSVGITTLNDAAFSPGTMAQLFDKLGGEFFIGGLNSSNTRHLEMPGTIQAMPGIQIGLHLGKGVEMYAAAQHFRTNWTGTFPVVVFSQDQGSSQQLKTMQGNLNVSASGILAETGLTYFFGKNRVQPYLSIGIRGGVPIQKNSSAQIAGVPLPVKIHTISTDYSLFGGVGARVTYWKKGSAEIGGSYGKIPGGSYISMLGLGIGWRFGGK